MSLLHHSRRDNDIISLRDLIDQYIATHERQASAAYQELKAQQAAIETRRDAVHNTYVTEHRREHQRGDDEFTKLREQVEEIHDWMSDMRGRMWSIGAIIGVGGPILSAVIMKLIGMN
jgi:hypothetical protein